jgi:thiamine phosphate synthase YjbQ (UPF0047 family)
MNAGATPAGLSACESPTRRPVVVAISKGRLDFGPWEQICYGESDGRSPKRVPVTLIGQ